MKYELSEKIITNKSRIEVLNYLLMRFKENSEKIIEHNDFFESRMINSTFGSINRDDTTFVYVKDVQDGLLIVAKVKYEPSVMFWILLLILIFTGFGWIFPIGFYFYHQSKVKEGIMDIFNRTKNEFHSTMDFHKKTPIDEGAMQIGQLEKLFDLKQKGIISEDEFNTKKKSILGN